MSHLDRSNAYNRRAAIAAIDPRVMKNKTIVAAVGVIIFAVSLWLLSDLAALVSVETLARAEVLVMLVPTALAIGFALLVWLHW
ncbi:hypothetical protein [Halobellus ordinarius]|uniref:hypothetical protein n=1 Tax=Halobellus ordinarius TaxID=3075120 RepID=UPI002880B314|nr:hypothetical protein [Halobellus sp. ZY16]